MKKIIYFITALLLFGIGSCADKQNISESISEYINVDDSTTIDIDTIFINGKAHYYLYCEIKDEWDEVEIDDSCILMNGFLLPHLNIYKIQIK